ncbi:MAG: DUF4070 domain-containing protein [Syntrophales bacterium]|jgi:radical SAM superfamily enzyme YgiQ (UPF0313 family)|nr:DUF4070 domain-containing protein [Syntrophales bacterium]MDY0044739.1 DUF4070 domain-containing protein [Syntrophales bacterium]
MNILLVYPRYPVTFWSFKYSLKFVSKKTAFPPLGLLTIAAMLPKEWNLRLVDMNIEKLRSKDLEWADYVMLSAMLIQKESVDHVLEQCRRYDKKVIAGGPLFTAVPDEYKNRIDHLILNEAENTLPLFLKDLENGCPGPIYNSDDFIDMAETPIPRWDLIRVKDYATLLVQYSRGCPFNCEFCDVTILFGHRPRLKSTEQFLSELQAIYDIGWRGSLFIVDDNFIGNKRAIKAMLPRIIEWMKDHHYPFTFFTEASINLAEDDELIDLMVKSAFDSVFVGLETPNEASLKECSKLQNVSLNVNDAIKKLQKAGLEVLGGYIIGFDNDDESIFSRQIKFIQETGVVTAMVGLLQALPNTRLWHRLKEEDRLEECATGNNTDGSLNFIPAMDKNLLMDGYRKMVKTIYSPKYYYQRLSRFLENYDKPKFAQKRKITSSDLKAFFRSIFYLGVLGNGISQWYYWKMILKSATFHRRAFPETITLIIFGHHFRKVAKKMYRSGMTKNQLTASG